MTELEKLMCKIMGKISQTDAPIVFKGALITHLILSEHGFDRINRTTTDVDSNWIGEPPSMETLVETISQSLGEMQNEYAVTAIREYGEKKSAGLGIVDKKTGEEIFTIDISMKPVVGSRIYIVGDMSIKGVLPDEVLADKIQTMSDRSIMWRMKDMIDVYALSHCLEIQTKNIFAVCEAKGKEIKDFDRFYNEKANVATAYSKLRRVENKPDFDVIYSYMEKFIKPFAEKDHTNKAWNSEAASWHTM